MARTLWDFWRLLWSSYEYLDAEILIGSHSSTERTHVHNDSEVLTLHLWDVRLKSEAFTNSFNHGPAASEATKDTKGWHSSVLSQFIVIPERHNKICRHVERHDENHGENWGRDGLEFHDRVFWGETCDHGHPPGLVRPYWGHSSYSLESFFGMTYKCTPTNDGVKSSEYFIIAIF